MAADLWSIIQKSKSRTFEETCLILCSQHCCACCWIIVPGMVLAWERQVRIIVSCFLSLKTYHMTCRQNIVFLTILMLKFWKIIVNIMTADALDPCITRSPIAMVLGMQVNQVLVFHENGCALSVPSQCWGITISVNLFSYFPNSIEHDKGYDTMAIITMRRDLEAAGDHISSPQGQQYCC